ncbi:hypothetical protein ACFQ9X_08955 [Catenulispora yoronensis]
MDFQLLGDFQAVHDDAALDLGGRRRQAVLAVLLLNAGRTVSRQQIAQWAWPPIRQAPRGTCSRTTSPDCAKPCARPDR